MFFSSSDEKALRQRASLNMVSTPEQLESDGTETFWANFEAVRDSRLSNSYTRTILPEVDNQLGQLGDLLNDPALLPFRDGNGRPTSRRTSDRRFEPAHAEELLRRHRDVVNATPGLKTLEEIEDEAGARAVELEGQADALSSRGSGFAGFAGQLAGYMSDPVNLFTLPIGAANAIPVLGRTLGPVGGRIVQQALIEGATEAVIQTGVATYRQRIGLEHGAKEIAQDIGFAALGGGLFEAAGIGIAKAYRKAVGEGRIKATRAADEAAEIIEENAAVLDSNPTAGAKGSGKAHTARLMEVEQALLAGEPVALRTFASEAEERVLRLRDTLDQIRDGISEGSGARVERVKGAFAAEREALQWLHAAEAALAKQSELFEAGRVDGTVLLGPGGKPWKKRKDALAFGQQQKIFSGEPKVVKRGRGFALEFEQPKAEVPRRADAPEPEAPRSADTPEPEARTADDDLILEEGDTGRQRLFKSKKAAAEALAENADTIGPAEVVKHRSGWAIRRTAAATEAPTAPARVDGPGTTGTAPAGDSAARAVDMKPEEVEAAAARILEENPELDIPTEFVDANGDTVRRPAREVFEEIELQESALADVKACMLSQVAG